jgi:hypothetical protein
MSMGRTSSDVEQAPEAIAALARAAGAMAAAAAAGGRESGSMAKASLALLAAAQAAVWAWCDYEHARALLGEAHYPTNEEQPMPKPSVVELDSATLRRERAELVRRREASAAALAQLPQERQRFSARAALADPEGDDAQGLVGLEARSVELAREGAQLETALTEVDQAIAAAEERERQAQRAALAAERQDALDARRAVYELMSETLGRLDAQLVAVLAAGSRIAALDAQLADRRRERFLDHDVDEHERTAMDCWRALVLTARRRLGATVGLQVRDVLGPDDPIVVLSSRQ